MIRDLFDSQLAQNQGHSKSTAHMTVAQRISFVFNRPNLDNEQLTRERGGLGGCCGGAMDEVSKPPGSLCPLNRAACTEAWLSGQWLRWR